MRPSTRKTRRLVALWPLLAMAALLVALAAGCGSDSSSGPGNNTTPKAVHGHAFKGGIDGASINLYNLTTTGDIGALVAGPFTTDATGAWSGEVPGSSTGTLVIIATGGSYVDEATGATVNVTSELYGLLDVDLGTGNATPLTHAIAVNAGARVDAGASVATAIDDAISGMTAALGYDPTSTDLAPIPRGAAPAQDAGYVVFLAGISQLLDPPPTGFESANVWDMVIAIAEDMSDGVLDGLDAAGETIMVDPGTGTEIPWPVLDGDDLSALIDAANQWAGGESLPPISNPDFSEFSDIGGGIGDGTPTGSVTVTGALNMTFTPASGQGVEGALLWWDQEESSLAVNSVLGTVTAVTFVTTGGGWQIAAPQSGVTLNGLSATFEGLQLQGILNPSSTIVLNGTVGFQ